MNTTSWNYAQSNSDANPRRNPVYRALTSPGAHHPLALMPGQVPQALDRPNLYFTNAARAFSANDVRNAQPSQHPVPLFPAQATHIQPPHFVPTLTSPPRPPLPPPLPDTRPSTHLHRSLTAPPPVPPKPFSAPPLPPPTDRGSSQTDIHTLPASTTQSTSFNSPTDEADMAMALALSESVSKEQQQTEQYLASQEEDDLAKALEVSMSEARNSSPSRMPVRSASSNADPLINDTCDDEVFARLLAAEEEKEEKTMAAVVSHPSEAKQSASINAHTQYSHLGPHLPDTATASMASLGRISSLHSRHSGHDESTSLSTLGLNSFPLVSNTSSAISDTCDDEALARLLAAEEENQIGAFLPNKTLEVHHNKYAFPVAHIDFPQYSAVESKGVLGNTSCDDDEAFARMLAAEEENYSRPPPATKASEAHHNVSSTPLHADSTLPQYAPREVFLDDRSPPPAASTGHRITVDDGAHGRSHPLRNIFLQASTGLARSADNEAHVNGDTTSASSNEAHPPQYSPQNHTGDGWSSRPTGPSTTHDEAHYSHPSSNGYFETALPPHEGRHLSASSSVTNPTKGVTYPNLAPPLYARGGGISTSESRHPPSEHPLVASQRVPPASSEDMPSSYAMPSLSPSTSSLNDHSLVAPTLQLDTSSMPNGGLARISSMTSRPDHYEDYVDSNEMRPSPSAINLNAFVDKELFNGVSVGFMAPKISSQSLPMADEMPLVISLPYGKARPLHVQGPSWRHLLKLMAKLSGTRIEPELNAVAATKTPPKLRTVIQFVKPHQTSAVWRTIFYFTVDYPSPRPDRLRGVNELPYSYSLAGIPTLLRDGADTPISKTYTIPASESVPYPTLPITFPELALYLQAALEESRRYLNDNSSGNRKLAKILKMCYPAEDGPQEPADRTSVGGLFKRMIGRSDRSGRRGGNEDTYEWVTPFVQDEWG